VAGLVESALHRGKGVVLWGNEASPTVEVHVELEWGRSATGVATEVQRRVAEYLERMANLTPASARRPPSGSRDELAARWAHRSNARDRAVCLPELRLVADPRQPGAGQAEPWVEQSLFLAAIGEARDKGARALEAFAYRYREGTPPAERFLVHRTVFPHDFLADFGFRTVRSAGRIELARLDLGGLQPVEEGTRRKVLRAVQEAFQPAPDPRPARRVTLGDPLAADLAFRRGRP